MKARRIRKSRCFIVEKIYYIVRRRFDSLKELKRVEATKVVKRTTIKERIYVEASLITVLTNVALLDFSILLVDLSFN